MFSNAIVFLLQTFLGLFSIALLLRFYLQLARAPARNPVSQFLAALTDFAVRPARRVIPGLWGVDLSTLVLAWLVELLLLLAVLFVVGQTFGAEVGLSVVGLVLLAAVNVIRGSLYILMGALIVQAVLSWVAPYSPIAPVVNSLTRPILRPIQRRIPPVGAVDLSPLFAIVACQLALMLPVAWLDSLVRSLL
ncbi:MAG: YggT family protein [Burkholderiales bacterium]|nr:YggT family protein [Burkholderiales bacterium]